MLEEGHWKVQGSWNGNILKMVYLPGTSVSHRREYPGDSSNDNRSYRGWRPLKEEDVQVRMGDCLIEGDILIGIEDLLEEEDILEEDPLMDRGPPDGGGPPGGNGGPPGGQGPPDPQGPPGPVRPVIVQMPHMTLNTYALEGTFDTVGNLCCNRLEHKIRLTDICSSISNRASSICKHIWALCSN